MFNEVYARLPRPEYHHLPMISERDILAVLRTIPDPEMPISIVDLGLVHDVRIDGQPAGGGGLHVHIDLLPTFVGCPALDMIAGETERAVLAHLQGTFFDPRVNRPR